MACDLVPHNDSVPDLKVRHLTILSGFSLTPYLEYFTPTFGLGTPVFPRICSNLHCGTPTFSKRCLWDSYFQNPSENPDCYLQTINLSKHQNRLTEKFKFKICHMIIESVVQAIFCLDFLLNIQYGYR